LGGGEEKQLSDAIINQDSPNVAHEVYLNKPQAWSWPTGREHELPQSWNHLEARVGKEWLDTMTGKSLRKTGRDRQCEQHKKSAYMGKEEV
jgi:hypothetical protein